MGPRFPQDIGSVRRHPPFSGAGAGFRGKGAGFGEKTEVAGTAALLSGKGCASGDVGNAERFSRIAKKIPAVTKKVLDRWEDFE
jgi:hypothetical protein